MFEVGDSVMYPMYGVCTIGGIEEMDVFGARADYYVLHNSEGRVQVMVPVKTAEDAGLRYVSGQSEYDSVMDYLNNDENVSESANWNQRYRDNTERLKSGSIRSVAEVFKALHKRHGIKGLSTGERKIYQTAKRVLLSELMHISGKSSEDFERLFNV